MIWCVREGLCFEADARSGAERGCQAVAGVHLKRGLRCEDIELQLGIAQAKARGFLEFVIRTQNEIMIEHAIAQAVPLAKIKLAPRE